MAGQKTEEERFASVAPKPHNSGTEFLFRQPAGMKPEVLRKWNPP